MKQDNLITVCCVQPGSIAEEIGLEPGDRVISINGEKVKDIFDYRFLTTNEELLLEIEKADGEVWEVEVEKDEYEDLGVEFSNPMLDDAKSCTNQCIFCFVDQLPGGMRETLYFKDDDSRLSFLTGNYVTLTNIKNEDLDRIIRYRMSPINVSVHTTNPDLRVFMLKNRFAGDVLQKIEKLTRAGITVNCQIVLCKGVNDGRELDRTIEDISALYPGVYSVSLVPVGITRHRRGLPELSPFGKEEAASVINQAAAWQDKMLQKHDSRVIYLADEFYIMADYELPGYEDYEDFPQLENGVGLVSMLRHEYFAHVQSAETSGAGKREVSIATGVSAAKYIRELARDLESRFGGLKINVYEIKNLFFGENVTVTGLLTGQDIYSQMKDRSLGSELLICRSMLRSGEEVFLDDYTIGRLSEELGIRITVVDNSGSDFIDKAIGKR